MPSNDEALLIKRARQGERDAIAALYRRHVQAIYRYVRYRVPEDAAADDLTAEVFLRMVEGLPRFQLNGAPFEAWLYRIASARVADHYRQRSRHPQQALSDTQADRSVSPEGVLQTTEEEAELRTALQQLSAEHQDILLLRFVERKSHAEVAEILGKSVTAIKSAQHRALSRLAELLGSNGKARHYLRGSDE
ncbi:MAG: sigma-70 family RNA polymerase sigma factor [Anaerolineae bacterium]|nr:sigma-70 family RNA polymerase sigma factor [Anaerolineae bacterium]